jgi:transcriptional regulator with XRE-family HTH domain
MKGERPTRTQLRNAFARAVRALRLHGGISQEGLALAAGVDRSYMGEIERGLRSPSIETIFRLLPALGVTFTRFAQEVEKQLRRAGNGRLKRNGP